MTYAAIGALAAAVTPIVIALLSGVIAVWSLIRTRANSIELQNLKGAVDSDLEKLKARLSHGQIISSTQWNAEFMSYQAIWKGMVAIRTQAMKIVLREDELVGLRLPLDYLASAGRAEIRKDLIQKYVEATRDLLLAIHENAPFYPQPIRQAANHTHQLAKTLFDRQVSASAGLVAEDEKFKAECKNLLRSIMEGVDQVESLIRDRLAAVEVIGGVRA